MNPKQTVPLLVTLAPVIAAAPAVLVVGAISLAAAWLLRCLLDGSEDGQPDAAPANEDAENQRTAAETPIIPQIPAVQPVSVPVPPVPRVPVQPAPIRPVPVISPPVQAVRLPVPAIPQPFSKRFVTRADLAMIFANGARSLSRTTAVAALKQLGFGKTAAYAALSPDGRFNAWLHCAPDGIITWKN